MRKTINAEKLLDRIYREIKRQRQDEYKLTLENKLSRNPQNNKRRQNDIEGCRLVILGLEKTIDMIFSMQEN